MSSGIQPCTLRRCQTRIFLPSLPQALSSIILPTRKYTALLMIFRLYTVGVCEVGIVLLRSYYSASCRWSGHHRSRFRTVIELHMMCKKFVLNRYNEGTKGNLVFVLKAFLMRYFQDMQYPSAEHGCKFSGNYLECCGQRFSSRFNQQRFYDHNVTIIN